MGTEHDSWLEVIGVKVENFFEHPIQTIEDAIGSSDDTTSTSRSSGGAQPPAKPASAGDQPAGQTGASAAASGKDGGTPAKTPAANYPAANTVLKNDASSNIDTLVDAFTKDITDWVAKFRKEKTDKDGKTAVPNASFKVGPAKYGNQMRTPGQQAQKIVEINSWVCWGAHMADKARDILMWIDGKYDPNLTPDAAFGDYFGDFKKAWMDLRKSRGLLSGDAGNPEGWFGKDPFHVEVPDARIPNTDARVDECIKEYVRLAYVDKTGKVNGDFEGTCEKDGTLKPILQKYKDQAVPPKK